MPTGTRAIVRMRRRVVYTPEQDGLYTHVLLLCLDEAVRVHSGSPAAHADASQNCILAASGRSPASSCLLQYCMDSPAVPSLFPLCLALEPLLLAGTGSRSWSEDNPEIQERERKKCSPETRGGKGVVAGQVVANSP